MNLHLGCGTRRLAGWVNADADPTLNPDLVLSIPGDLATLADGAYDRVYASHVVEHIAPDLLPAALRHLYRALRYSGRLTLATIDLDGIYHNAYLKGYSAHDWNAYLYGDTKSTDNPLMAHRQCFTAASLNDLLLAAGFTSTRPWSLAEYPDLAALNDCASSSWHVTIYLEACK